MALAISPDGRWLVTGSDGRHRTALGPQGRRPREDRTRPEGAPGPCRGRGHQPRRSVAGHRELDNTARLWDLKADDPAKTARVFKGHQEPCQVPWPSAPTGRWLVTGSDDEHRTALGPQGRRPREDRSRPQGAPGQCQGPGLQPRRVGGWRPGATTRPHGSGTSRPTTPEGTARVLWGTRAMSGPWPSAPTGGGWSRRAATTPHGSGTSRPTTPRRPPRPLGAREPC